jgi:predicted dehydrogenase
MKTPYRLALIGCGARGTGYPLYLRRLGYEIELTAAVDPNFEQAEMAATQFGSAKSRIFASAAEMLDRHAHELDGAIIASPNHTHAANAVEVFAAGIPLLLEKPVAVSQQQLADLWTASAKAGHSCVIGFTLRYTPFYSTVRRLIAQGALGTVLAIHAEEQMSDRLSSLFSRGNWRPDAQATGGLMLEKCCHDLDILSWLLGSRISEVHSFARRTFLHPIPEAGASCDACGIEPDCRFSYDRIMASFRQGTAVDEHFDKRATQFADRRCVWTSKTTYPDHQTVNLAFESGALGTFTVAQAQPRNERTLSILGTDARLEGVFERGIIRLIRRTGPNNDSIEEIPVVHDGSGHGGGDSFLVKDFVSLMDGNGSDVRASLGEAIDAAIASLATDQSCRENRTIPLDEWRSAIFCRPPASAKSHLVHSG